MSDHAAPPPASHPNQGGPESNDSNEGGPESKQPNEGRPESTPAGQERTADGWSRERVAKRLNGAGAAVLILEALVLLFVPRAIAQTGPGLTATRLTLVFGVVGALIIVAGLQRRPWGRWAGLAVQLPVLATGLLTAAMWFLGVLFLGLWVYLLRIRADQLGSDPAQPARPPGDGDG